ncbi:TauD/TfdA family dioxygenase [Bradyrhizobium liaoningense]|uniref:TauD/TfdA family dioxygenase n=1 Tax=Bradyrhizobium liaoningense TaxID=43992 RepID=UPI001BA7B27D|nr:TauD/TfdA family dioxygenase [Bradyrhizobium liaoningense]MBR1069137.1 TauD/TfdA family dioxygenase [Bradyrhizobium liaoningense]
MSVLKLKLSPLDGYGIKPCHMWGACPHLGDVDPDVDPDTWEREGGTALLRVLESNGFPFPEELVHNHLALHIAGLGIPKLRPETPYSGKSNYKELLAPLTALFGTVKLIGGKSFSFANENSGAIIRDIAPRKDAEKEASSQGWAHELHWHMDGAFKPLIELSQRTPAPRWLVFVSIYNCPETPITFVDLDEVIKTLQPSVIKTLMLPIFDVCSPASFSPPELSKNFAILLKTSSSGFFSRYNQTLTRTTKRAGVEALAEFSRAVRECGKVHKVDVRPGDVVVLDNWRTLHMRPAYQPRWDGADRWLLRVYAAENHRQIFPVNESAPRLCR